MKEIVYSDPDLIELPTLYSDLHSFFSQKKCKVCLKSPIESSICLICGEHFSYYQCRETHEVVTKHNSNCRNGFLILMDIKSTVIKVIRNYRLTAFPSIYLDEHGEEDINLK